MTAPDVLDLLPDVEPRRPVDWAGFCLCGILVLSISEECDVEVGVENAPFALLRGSVCFVERLTI